MYAFKEAHVAELRHFLDAVQSGRETLIPIQDGLSAQILVEGAMRSLQTGSPVAIEPR